MILPQSYLALVHEWNNKPPQTSILHDNVCLSMIVLNILLILPYLLCPYESKIYDFCRFIFLYVQNIEHQSLVLFLLLTSIYKDVLCLKGIAVLLLSIPRNVVSQVKEIEYDYDFANRHWVILIKLFLLINTHKKTMLNKMFPHH